MDGGKLHGFRIYAINAYRTSGDARREMECRRAYVLKNKGNIHTARLDKTTTAVL